MSRKTRKQFENNLMIKIKALTNLSGALCAHPMQSRETQMSPSCCSQRNQASSGSQQDSHSDLHTNPHTLVMDLNVQSRKKQGQRSLELYSYAQILSSTEAPGSRKLIFRITRRPACFLLSYQGTFFTVTLCIVGRKGHGSSEWVSRIN